MTSTTSEGGHREAGSPAAGRAEDVLEHGPGGNHAAAQAHERERRRVLDLTEEGAMKGIAYPGLLVFGLVVAGCGSQQAVSLGEPPQQPATTAQTTTAVAATPAPTISFEVWFARGDRLVSETRSHAATQRVATAAIAALLAGPNAAERAAGDTTAIPTGTRLLGVSVKDGVANVDLTSEYQSGGGSLAMQMRLGQVVYTLTQFPTVKRVRFALDGAPVNVFSSEGIVLDHPVGRADYENLAAAPA